MKTDADLQRHVLEELDWEPSVNAAKVGVTAAEGIVTLLGHVATYAEKLAAEQVAKRVHGVKAVANELVVEPCSAHCRDDADLAVAALNAIAWDAGVPHDRIQVTVRSGEVLLEGDVDAQYQKMAAQRAVSNLIGVRHVENNITIRPAAPNGEITRSIEAAFQRSALLNSQRICVKSDGGTVILAGDVHSHNELDEAERTAWAARGVTQVENCLTVTPWGSGPSEEWGY